MFNNPKMQYARVLQARQDERVAAGNGCAFDQAERHGHPPETDGSSRRRVAAMILAVVAVAACSASDDAGTATTPTLPEPTLPDATTSSTTSSTVASDETDVQPASLPADADGALGQMYDFVEAINAGDVERVLARLPKDGNLRNASLQGGTPLDVEGYQDVAEVMAWITTIDMPARHVTCALAPDTGQVDVVDCTFLWDDVLRRTLGYVPLPAGFVATVEQDGTFSQFEHVAILRSGSGMGQLGSWLATAHPDDAGLAGRLAWDSVEDAVASGEARDRHVDEWTASLDDD